MAKATKPEPAATVGHRVDRQSSIAHGFRELDSLAHTRANRQVAKPATMRFLCQDVCTLAGASGQT